MTLPSTAKRVKNTLACDALSQLFVFFLFRTCMNNFMASSILLMTAFSIYIEGSLFASMNLNDQHDQYEIIPTLLQINAHPHHCYDRYRITPKGMRPPIILYSDFLSRSLQSPCVSHKLSSNNLAASLFCDTKSLCQIQCILVLRAFSIFFKSPPIPSSLIAISSPASLLVLTTFCVRGLRIWSYAAKAAGICSGEVILVPRRCVSTKESSMAWPAPCP